MTIQPGLPTAAASRSGPRRARRRWALAAGLLLAAFALHARADTYTFTAVAGGASLLDHTNGTGTNARFFNPTGAAVDGAGNIYLADGGDHTVRLVTPAGVVTTLAGTSGQGGSADGVGANALFLYPYAIAVDGSGNVYVTDAGNQNVRKIAPGGIVTTLAGMVGIAGSADGAGLGAQFNLPEGIAVDGAGNVLVSDTNNSTLRRISVAGVVTTLAGVAGQTGASDGVGTAARFNFPFGLAVDLAGNVYVADFGNSTIRKVTPGGAVTTLAGFALQTGATDGAGSAARFNHPSAAAVDAAGNVYVIDTSNQTVRKISAAGAVSTLAGTPTIGGRADGAGAAATFFYPAGIAVTAGGTAYVADTGNHALRMVTASGTVLTLAGSAGLQGSLNGTGTAARFAYPNGVAVDGSGNLYIADQNNATIRKLTPAGVVTTVAGAAGLVGSADGPAAAARFNSPAGVAVDGAGNLYVADTGNSTVRKISAAGTVSTLAGTALSAGSADGAGPGAGFNSPQGIAVDGAGNLYVADTNNQTIRKVTAAGVVMTLAGAAGQTGGTDGLGASARFSHPVAVAVDGSGNVYVADLANATIRKVTAAGAVTTLAGLAQQTGFTDATGGAARFNQPDGVAVDGAGNVWVADTYNRAVRKIAAGGVVTTVNGASSRFYYPQGIAVDGSGDLFVADGDNQAINEGVLVAAAVGLALPTGTARLINVSIRSNAGTGASTLTVGLVVSGAGAKQVLVRGIGPALTGFGVTGALATPQLALFNSTSVLLASNAGWGGSAALAASFAAVGAFALPVGSADAALYLALAGGAAYTAQISGLNGTTGVALAEVYDADTGTSVTRLSNVSARAVSGAGAAVLTAGFIVGGAGTDTLVIRGIGPTLAQYGVTGVLAAPQLTLFGSAGQVIATNSGWGGGAVLTAAFVQVGAFALPTGSADSALIATVAPGVYTVQVGGTNGATGVGLVEIYESH